jgi:hypothetical protein
VCDTCATHTFSSSLGRPKPAFDLCCSVRGTPSLLLFKAGRRGAFQSKAQRARISSDHSHQSSEHLLDLLSSPILTQYIHSLPPQTLLNAIVEDNISRPPATSHAMLLNHPTRKMALSTFMLMLAVTIATVGAGPIRCKPHLSPHMGKATLTVLQHVKLTRLRAPTTLLAISPSRRPSTEWMC